MRLPAILAALALALFTLPAFAACDLFDDIRKQVESYEGYSVMDVPAEDIPDLLAAIGVTDLAVTRAFVTSNGSSVVVGLEVDGCILPPIFVTTAAPAADRLSGRQPDGRVWA